MSLRDASPALKELLAPLGRLAGQAAGWASRPLGRLRAGSARAFDWADRRLPWVGRHRVLAVSVINSVSIILLASIAAWLLLRTPEAAAVSREPLLQRSGTEAGAERTRAAAALEARSQAVRRIPPRPAAAPSRIGERDYEVRVRRPARPRRASPEAEAPGATPPAEVVPPPPDETVIERSDEFAPEDPRAHRGQ